jgi:hypothetical protein
VLRVQRPDAAEKVQLTSQKLLNLLVSVKCDFVLVKVNIWAKFRYTATPFPVVVDLGDRVRTGDGVGDQVGVIGLVLGRGHGGLLTLWLANSWKRLAPLQNFLHRSPYRTVREFDF